MFKHGMAWNHRVTALGIHSPFSKKSEKLLYKWVFMIRKLFNLFTNEYFEDKTLLIRFHFFFSFLWFSSIFMNMFYNDLTIGIKYYVSAFI